MQLNRVTKEFNAAWLVVISLLAMYVPTYYFMATTLWQKEEYAHGFIVVAVVIYLLWDKRDYLEKLNPINGHFLIPYLVLIFGLLLYLFGRSQSISFLEIGSQLFVFSALLWLVYGYKALRTLWFPIFFIFFMIPLPGFFVDSVTQPMKMAVSYVADNILYFFDYPISRTGVMLKIGQYQLLVADACAGLHTLISLEAIGLLYLNLIKSDSYFRNITLALLIIPISFTANVIRVIVLTLVTYYFGDEIGQGFIHGFAGIFLFVVAIMLILSVDKLIIFIDKTFINKET